MCCIFGVMRDNDDDGIICVLAQARFPCTPPIIDVAWLKQVAALVRTSKHCRCRVFFPPTDFHIILHCGLWGKKTAPFYFCNKFVKTCYSAGIIGTYILR